MRGDDSGIVGWTKNSFIDFPRTIACVCFFSGCNLRCPYCHNPEIATREAAGTVPVIDILDFLEKRRGIVEGVVLSGGEPTIHETVGDFVDQIRSIGLKIKLDTNGMLPEKIRNINPDYLALDVKTIPTDYISFLKAPFTDVSDRLAESIAIVRSMKENGEIRITVAPGIISREVIDKLGPMLAGVMKVYLQPMQTRVRLLDPAMKERKEITREEMMEFRELLLTFVGDCEIRGDRSY